MSRWAAVALGTVFLAWNGIELYRCAADPLPDGPAPGVQAHFEQLRARLNAEMERQKAGTAGSSAEGSDRLEKLAKILESGIAELQLPAQPAGTLRTVYAPTAQALAAARLAVWELQGAHPEAQARAIEREARAQLILAMAEIRAGLLNANAAGWETARREREIRYRRAVAGFAAGVLVLTVLTLAMRRFRHGPPETGLASPWTAGIEVKPRTGDLVINLDDKVVSQLPAARGSAGAAGESGAATDPEPAAGSPEGARLLAAAAARSLHHDLTVINGYTDLLLESLSGSEAARTDLRAIRRAGERANVLAGQLQAYSDSTPARWDPLDINEWLKMVQPRIEALLPPGIAFRYLPGDGELIVRGDPERLEQALKSLVVNATDAMPSGGTLTIEAEEVELGSGETYAAITVRDTGRGIDRAALRQIFETRSGSTQRRSTGIGLQAVAAILEEHLGHVDVESAPGAGSAFRLTIPRLAAEREARTAASAG